MYWNFEEDRVYNMVKELEKKEILLFDPYIHTADVSDHGDIWTRSRMVPASSVLLTLPAMMIIEQTVFCLYNQAARDQETRRVDRIGSRLRSHFIQLQRSTPFCLRQTDGLTMYRLGGELRTFPFRPCHLKLLRFLSSQEKDENVVPNL
jgi:hypothetical protein